MNPVDPAWVLLIGRPAIALLYIGPDQALPLLSLLGAIIGIVLTFWRKMTNLGRRVLRLVTRR